MKCGISDLRFGDQVCDKCRKSFDLNVRLMPPGRESPMKVCKLCGEIKACLPVAVWKNPVKMKQNMGLLKSGQVICTWCAELLDAKVSDAKPKMEICEVCDLKRVCSSVARNHVPRPGWDDYFLQIATVAGSRSTCLRRNTGAVLVRDKQMLTTGYNGAPRGAKHCLDVGCLRAEMGIASGDRLELCRGAHAEENAIAQAARHGVSIDGAMLYCTNYPCTGCMKILINAGVVRVICTEDYDDDLAKQIAKDVGLLVECKGKQKND